MGTWVRRWSRGADYLESLGGTDWPDTDPPRRWHWCSAQTRGMISGGLVERCRCGGIRLGGLGPWLDRNTRRRPA